MPCPKTPTISSSYGDLSAWFCVLVIVVMICMIGAAGCAVYISTKKGDKEITTNSNPEDVVTV